MALYYNLVFGLLVIEMVLFTTLSLPLPSKIRKPILKAISAPFQKTEVNVAIKCVLVFIFVLFVDSVNRVNTINEELTGLSTSQNLDPTIHNTYNPMADRSEIQARRFYAQRNMYLTGFTLFLTLILTRTYRLVAELLSLKEEYRSDPDHVSSNDEIAQLKIKIKQKDEDLEILKNQARSLAKEYDDLGFQSTGSFSKLKSEKKLDLTKDEAKTTGSKKSSSLDE
ncbi:Endoplasmic reticulum transmembrane protein 3 [Wickerhamomyces ciferrii]|uniref:Endoplasmic reticulum transmembrane protein n=1 Tax=Wickerhamomyces ciferrii (strain ATCC 14091 / BCRC 22168 / CBS 111 / JCM 3599 / NBRC 0793 / NRRL Y-1031 F-60-10) TaxID=1206466 RepID=K0KYF7_WICCF|nr:Endoplasmic reticulum transmembrane protein 3 [Wickerhamomyces ciferrii]CCH46123.1 Endoplasmic reticulum transmembrane protein 3 [Wickerhamomyces ciferrii]